MYTVFHRTWWKPSAAWPGGLQPGAGKKKVIARNVPNETEARRLCKEWNANHKPGKLADKAEYEET